jgi:hypothetical protein
MLSLGWLGGCSASHTPQEHSRPTPLKHLPAEFHHQIADALFPEADPVIHNWLLLDSRVVDVPMASNPPFVMLSFLKPLFFNSLKHKLRFSDNTGA